jgi:hypothetical protein
MRILAILLLCAVSCYGAVFTPGGSVTLQQVTNIANAAAAAAGGPTNGTTATTVTNIATALDEAAFQASTNHSRNASNVLRSAITVLQTGTGSLSNRVDGLEADVSDHGGRIDALELGGGGTQNTNTLPVFRATNIVAESITADAIYFTSLTLSGGASFVGPVTNAGALYLTGLSGSGSHLTIDGSGNVTKTTISGTAADTSTNIVVSSPDDVVLNFAVANRFDIKLLTNANLVFSNASSLTRRGKVFLQQDTNGQRVTTWRVAGGLIQTNASLQVTTNANAADLLECEVYQSTNIWVWWLQNFQPRVAFTNSLASGGGGGGGGGGFSSSNPSGLGNWLKADALSLNDGDAVSSWTASQGGAATQADSLRYPVFKTAIYGSLPTVRFDGQAGANGDSLGVSISAGAAKTVFVVVKRTSGNTLWGLGNDAQIYNSDGGVWRYWSPDTGAAAGSAASIGVIVVRYNSTGSADIRAQSGSWVNWNPHDSFSSATTLTIGDVSDSGGASTAGDICEVLVYGSALSDADCNLVGNYLERWGFTWTDL